MYCHFNEGVCASFKQKTKCHSIGSAPQRRNDLGFKYNKVALRKFVST